MNSDGWAGSAGEQVSERADVSEIKGLYHVLSLDFIL